MSRVRPHAYSHSVPTRRSSDLVPDLVRRADAMRLATLDLSRELADIDEPMISDLRVAISQGEVRPYVQPVHDRSEEHTSELQSLRHLVCRLLLEKKNK